ncbi:MAG TPA: transcription antitermination factor NusB, partial [Solirubrobacteraceae bacterium]|nr:transcription antitermination factor NusB [Solirubrobacteraceae bacterium]
SGTPTPARVVAHRVIVRVLEQGAYADRALHGEGAGLDGRERAFAQRLVYGAVQRRGTLDHVIAALVERPPPAVARAALQLGLYQLLFLDGVPARAAVSESVELVKGHRAAGMVNAVLRRVARDGFELPSDETPAGAALRHSHPRWLVDLWWDWLGADEARALLAADNEPAEFAVRVNTLVEPDPARLTLPEGPFDAASHPDLRRGAFVVQSTASQLVAQLVDPQPGERVLDLCAAPGNKTTHLAALMGDRGEVVAYERHPGRAEALRRRCELLRATCVTVVAADAAQATGTFDRVLLDPPCSGLGTLQRNPDLRWRMTPERIEALAAEQRGLLEVARARVAPGGRLVYSTCTLSPAEELLDRAGARRTWPHRDGTDGFYIAVEESG